MNKHLINVLFLVLPTSEGIFRFSYFAGGVREFGPRHCGSLICPIA